MSLEDSHLAHAASARGFWKLLALVCGISGFLTISVLEALKYGTTSKEPADSARHDPAVSEELQPGKSSAGSMKSPSDGAQRFWKLLGHEGPVGVVAVAPAGDRLLSADTRGTLLIWDFHAGEPLVKIDPQDFQLRRATFSSNVEYVIACANDPVIRIWSTKSGMPVRELRSHAAVVTSVRPIPGKSQILSSSFDASLIVWDLETGQPIRQFGTAPNAKDVAPQSVDDLAQLAGHFTWIRDVVVLPDGKRAVSAGNDAVLFVWDIDTGTLLDRLIDHPSVVMGLALSPDGHFVVAIGSDKTVTIWDMESRKVLRRWDQTSDKPPAVAIAADSKTLAIGGDDALIHFFDMVSAEEVSKLETGGFGVASLAFTPDGELICGGLDGTIQVWPERNGQ